VSQIPSDLLYTKDHEWIRVQDAVGTVGITDHAQEALSDLTFVDLPKVGQVVREGEEAAAVESCKAAASVYAPASGTVVEVNAALQDDPGRVNADCYGEGWMFRLDLACPAELPSLLTAEQYAQVLGGEKGG
jgi:glycine cleavage system H protein